ncbi:MAG TPA: hypothetical protein VN597_11795 [Streptosporangiaceae bacterium]|nr:hypothetical protein [Streptosporangiaceae bacterium]
MSEQTDQARLERGYRRLLACYPASFRRESEDEILAVLLDTARDSQRRVGLAESADLIRGALRMRLRPPGRPPRTLRGAVKLMCLGAAVELASLITIAVTFTSVRQDILQRDPAHWPAVLAQIIIDAVAAPLGMALWLFLAWGISRGQDWARLVSGALFCLLTGKLIVALAGHAIAYARADLIAGGVLWVLALAVLALIFSRPATRYFQPQPQLSRQ